MAVKGDTLADLALTPSASMGDRSTALSAQSAGDRGPIRRALTSESFIEKVALLFLTVALTGVLGPLIINYFNSAATERQKELDARKTRDDSILQAQSKLLDEAAEIILTYETLALDVSWYKQPRGENEDMHRKAFDRYGERIVDLVAKWQALISRSRTLASPAVSDKLESFLNRMFAEQDTPINDLVRKKAPRSEWLQMHQKSETMLRQANALITELAKDMKLSRDDLHQ